MPEFDGDIESRYREHAAPLHPRGDRGARRLTGGTAAPGSGTGPRILAFDTGGAACSVSVAVADTLLSVDCREMVHGHAEALLPMVAEAMQAAGLTPTALDLVAATVGPGSFTGIRVGLAAARGIALATAVPLLGVTRFAAVAACRSRGGADSRRLLVALDSRRAELFVQLFEAARPYGTAAAVPPEKLRDWLDATCGAQPLVVAGDAAERACAALRARPVTSVAADRTPAAVGVAREALRRWQLGERDDRAEPLYLRSPDVTLPRPAIEPPAIEPA